VTAPATGLTQRQALVLQIVKAHIGRTGASPTFEELRVAVGLKSKSGIHRLVDGLVARGRLVRLPARHRTLALPPPANRAQDALWEILNITDGHTNSDVVAENLAFMIAQIRTIARKGLQQGLKS
jgi:SOS-response transcriptional repressor LexA